MPENFNTISGNYDTTEKEKRIVRLLFEEAGINSISIDKCLDANYADIIIKDLKNLRQWSVEVKEESVDRIMKYNDLGIDFISVFRFESQVDEQIWKGSPKHSRMLKPFEESIKVSKLGKIYYSKADFWLFFCYDYNKNQIIFSEWYLGEDITSPEFIDYLRENCKFAVNNKPSWQQSHKDRHQSATFFISREDPKLLSLKKNVIEIFNSQI